MRAMRSPTSPVRAWKARLCLSCKIHVEYSFCRIRLPATGLTLPWQLVAAHEPGPMYLIGSGVSVAADVCGRVAKINTARSKAEEAKEELYRFVMRQDAESSDCLYRPIARQVNQKAASFG